MASLLTLPDELLLLVTTTLRHDKPTLCKLALVSQRLHQIVRETIFQHAIPYFSAHGYPTLTQIRPASDLLERSLSENPSLRELVWAYGPITSLKTNDEKDEISMVKGLDTSWGEQQLFTCFPHLKELYFDCICRDDGCMADELKKLSKNLYSNALRSVTLLGSPCLSTVATCLAFPRIETMELNSVQASSDCNVDQSVIRSSIRKLSLCNARYKYRNPAQDKIVRQILVSCPHLEELRWEPNLYDAGLRLPVYMAGQASASAADPSKVPGSDSKPMELKNQLFQEFAREITCALVPVVHSLKRLEVSAFGVRWFMDRCHSRSLPLDLTPLVALHHLDISAFFLLPATFSESSWKDIRYRDGMLKGLPRGLECLRITLPTHKATTRDPIGAVYSHRYWCDDWAWMLQLPKAKLDSDLPDYVTFY